MSQFFRFAIVGGVTNFFGYVLYLILTSLETSPKFTMTFLYFIGAILGFLGNKTLTFFNYDFMSRLLFRFMLIYLFGYFLNLLILIFFVDKLGFPHQFVQAVAIFLIAVFLFFSLKIFVFKQKNSMPMH